MRRNAKPAKTIRVAILRADTHSYYFGALMAPCDASLLMQYNKIVHYYFSDWYNERHLTCPRVPAFEIVKVWDYQRERAQQMSETFLGKPQVCDAPAEMGEGIDLAFISDCDGGGGDHLKLAAPFLRRGIPTFVDKPFALTLADARAMVALAKRHGAPLYNASMMSLVPAADGFKRRFDEIGPRGGPWTETAQAAVGLRTPVHCIRSMLGVVKGLGGALSQENVGRRNRLAGLEDRLAYIIHGIALAINVFGKGVAWVEAMGALPLEFLHLHLRNGRDVLVLNSSMDVFPESCSFFVEAYTKMGAIHSGPIGDPQFIPGGIRLLRNVRDMVRSGQPPVPYADLLEPIAVVEAGQRAQKTGQRVALPELIQ